MKNDLIQRLTQEFLDVLLPARCPGCREPVVSGQHVFCEHCTSLLETATSVRGARADRWELLVAGFAYGGPLADAIVRFKHGGQPALGGRLAHLAIRNAAPPPSDLVVPVPLHPRRLAKRGFNQAAVVARVVARAARGGPARRVLARVRDTPSQGGRGRAQRRENVKGAFRMRPGRDVAGASVLLVDDVWTTGATAGECAAVLKRAGARRVRVYTLARVV